MLEDIVEEQSMFCIESRLFTVSGLCAQLGFEAYRSSKFFSQVQKQRNAPSTTLSTRVNHAPCGTFCNELEKKRASMKPESRKKPTAMKTFHPLT